MVVPCGFSRCADTSLSRFPRTSPGRWRNYRFTRSGTRTRRARSHSPPFIAPGASLLGALLVFGNRRWPDERYIAVAAPAILAGVAYTIFSEWHNTEVRNSWAYSSLMPTLPGLGTGLSPLLQWFVIPIAAFWWARPRRASQFKPVEEAS